MNPTNNHDERIATMLFATVYQLYHTNVEQQGRTKEQLDEIIRWLTGHDEKKIKNAKAMQLQVNMENKAKDCYEKLGFKRIPNANCDIGNGFVMNDYVMELSILN